LQSDRTHVRPHRPQNTRRDHGTACSYV
jgi:hypothetical protein